MAETIWQKNKKNKNRVAVKDRAFYPTTQKRSYKVKLRDEKNISSDSEATGMESLF